MSSRDDAPADPPASLPYGTWPSPISPETLTARTVQLSLPQVDGPDTYWLEGRPEEAGRTVLVRRTADGRVQEAVGPMPDGTPADVRSRVHEYGGPAYAVRDGVLVLSHVTDGRLYLLRTGADAGPRPLTPEGPLRFMDPVLDLDRGLVYAVREDHGVAAREHGEAVNELVAVPLDGSAAEAGAGVAVLVAGRDFVSSAALSPDGRLLAWIAWDHPEMPWTSSELHVGEIADHAGSSGATPGTVRLAGDTVLAGGAGVSVAQPVWTATGDLVHVDDSSGWWNLYRTEGLGRPRAGTAGAGTGRRGPRTRALHPGEMEFTRPQWTAGPRSVAVLDEEHLVCSWTRDGRWHLGAMRAANGELDEWPLEWEPVGDVCAGDGRVVLVAASPTRAPALLEVDLERRAVSVLRRSTEVELSPADLSVARPVSWPTADGARAHGFFYAPASATARGPADERPPLIVMAHGGPTSAVDDTLRLGTQFWTSRGFAVLDVNYGGSTGYGRAYRDRLDGRWGEVDVADCAAGATHLAGRGLVDGARMAIRGGSAGGFTTLAALTSTEVFSAGASLYGIGDLETFVGETHKFESRYLFRLVGPYPQERRRYLDRSAAHHTDQLTAPVLLLQGTDDKVVPPGQARQMADAATARGLPVALVMLDGEAHGFRRAESIQAAVLAELSFYGQVWGFEPAGEVPPVRVDNLTSR
ncbi:S9 family peptidase [Georgenia sp. SYP-B2076]|uniref:alpha/beta hydrolase family protein n=1 Tax=Georgenia sp. SYP-B2076 TaxID=2495881 RepID=UPI000F8CD6CA|nr:S9 family peptidase [Georgenia sp. SYP-B2076]